MNDDRLGDRAESGHPFGQFITTCSCRLVTLSGGDCKRNPFISGKPRLVKPGLSGWELRKAHCRVFWMTVKYCNLARSIVVFWELLNWEPKKRGYVKPVGTWRMGSQDLVQWLGRNPHLSAIKFGDLEEVGNPRSWALTISMVINH